MDREKFSSTIKKKVANGKAEDALNLLLACIDNGLSSHLRHDVVMLSSQLQTLKRKELLNIPYEESHRNRVVLAILELTDAVLRDNNDTENIVYANSIKKYRSNKIRIYVNENEFTISIFLFITLIAVVLGINAVLAIIMFLFIVRMEGKI